MIHLLSLLIPHKHQHHFFRSGVQLKQIYGHHERRKNFFTCRNCGGGDRGRVAIYRPFGEVSLSLNRTVTCMVLKANDRRTSCPCHDEFRGPRSDYVRQVALATTTTTTTRQIGNSNFLCVVHAELATMCFVSNNVANKLR
ncbi:uncharacterized protein TNCV_2746001 [Trichonephila clavipes]|nr:uncharacterized protein TNCV_2746001 [Trichonephila clavipes]